MNANMTQNNEEMEIDVGRVVRAVLDQAWLVCLVTALCAMITIVGTYFLITPKYQASAKFYVNNSSRLPGDGVSSMSSGDLSTSRNLVDSYMVILNTKETLLDVIEYSQSKLSFEDVQEMIEAKAVNETEIFEVIITSTDPHEALRLADAISEVLPRRISTIIDGTSAKVVETAVLPVEPSSPSYLMNAVIGALLGFMVMVTVIVLREVFDVTIRSEEDIEQCCKHPILAAVPDMTAPSKGGSYYEKSKKSKGGAYSTEAKQKRISLMGKNVSFAASEAYKLLRTKLQFSFAGDKGCRVIGLSSALSGEGKSLTAVNVAYTLSQLNKKVILIDCDMRRPTLAEKLGISKTPGLSSFLTGQCDLEELLQDCNLKGEEEAFAVITAGQNPPNPVELLSSARMEKALEVLRKYYDYVILDLPPVGEVTDAMAVAKKTDGMLLVVRQNYCDRIVLADAVRQFAFINSKILGIVMNCTVESTRTYGKSYYRRYYKYYGSSYANNDRSVAGSKKTKTKK